MVKEKNWSNYPREIQAWLNHPDEEISGDLIVYEYKLREDPKYTVMSATKSLTRMVEYYREAYEASRVVNAETQWGIIYHDYVAIKHDERKRESFLEELGADEEDFQSEQSYVAAHIEEMRSRLFLFEEEFVVEEVVKTKDISDPYAADKAAQAEAEEFLEELDYVTIVYEVTRILREDSWAHPIDVVVPEGCVVDPHTCRKLLMLVPQEVILGKAHKSVPTV
jgi:hypothetical protein